MSEFTAIIVSSLVGGALICAMWYAAEHYERWVGARADAQDTSYGGALDGIWARFASPGFRKLPLDGKLWETREAAKAILAILADPLPNADTDVWCGLAEVDRDK